MDLVPNLLRIINAHVGINALEETPITLAAFRLCTYLLSHYNI